MKLRQFQSLIRGAEFPSYVILVWLVCLALDIRFVTSIATLLLPLLIILSPARGGYFKRAFTDPYFLCVLALFIVQLCGVFYTHDSRMQGWEVNKKSAAIAIAFFFCASGPLSRRMLFRILASFALALALACLICLGLAFARYSSSGDAQVFFYHALVAPLEHHAVIFSFFLLFVILYWLEIGRKQTESIKVKKAGDLLVIFFLGMIVLLSSKLVLSMVLVYLLVFIIREKGREGRRWMLPLLALIIAAMAALLSLTDNPVRKRFSDITTGSHDLFHQDRFTDSVYFNGLQFRLLNWRLTPSILTQRHAWLLGVSPGDAQHSLDRRYEEAGLYMGDPARNDTGFRGYNCHNVYLQVLLESGVIGLAILLASIVFFYVKAVRRSRLALIFFSAIIIFGMVESVLSSQYAIMLFVFLPLLSLSASDDEVH